jgi:phosphoglycerate dehydrogenase-like enzyme
MLERLKQKLAQGLGRARVDGYDTGALTAADEIPAARLIADLGLDVDQRPARDYPGWKRPDRVLVMGATAVRLDWLRAEAGGVDLIGAATAEEGERLVVDADALIGWFTASMIERGTRLRWMQIQRAGAESVVGQPLVASRGIVVTSLKRLASPVVADHAFGLLIALTRRLPDLLEHQRRQHWGQADVDASRLATLHGRTMLVAGLGGIGTALARRAEAFGMRVIALRAGSAPAPAFVERVGGPGDLADFVREAHVVINALPLTAGTERLFDAAMFARMRPDAIFINVGRGASVVSDDLAHALSAGQLAGAALDVTDPQPLPPGHPLWRMPNVVITPHVASWSASTAAWGWVIARENLRRYVAGEPLVSVVDLARGY